MQLKTTSYQDILDSLCSALELKEQVILDIIDSGYYMFQQDHQILYIDELYDCYFSIVKKNLKHNIESIPFYSISRRLNDNDNEGLSLLDLLTGDNSFSNYLKEYGLTFKFDNEIEMYVNGNKVDIPEKDRYKHYLKYRFKYNYAFKGYAFDDQLMNNEILEIVKYGPEFFGHLYEYIDNDDEIIDNYLEQSKLYKFEYLVPIDDIYFENYEELTYKEKQYHILTMMMLRLYFYKYDKGFVKTDELNPLMVVIDNKSLSSKYLINKTELDDEALG
ncbi:hypothetical protein [Candidatus Stoquefichus sp. SB1]|uniref:hypothetical protein n=1 Tax=Candidatus Stoquefichus sp. SB1 TaxID=1658109 RepID=UPI00067EC1CC|nr:hypothetical protein [Candidatus Stoquefichus sp. SB1]